MTMAVPDAMATIARAMASPRNCMTINRLRSIKSPKGPNRNRPAA